MLFTWSTHNLCIVFSSWRITGALSLIFSLVAIAFLTAGYEAVREAARRFEASTTNRVPTHSDTVSEYHDDEAEQRRSLLRPGAGAAAADERRVRIVKALFYAMQVFYSFFIMLLFMTYNGWVMLAVAVGAFIGYLMFGNGPAAKTVACH